MELYPSRMVEDVQEELLDTLGRRADVEAVGKELNRALRDLLARIRRNNQDWFKRTATITLVSGTAEYNLPLDCPPDGLTSVEPYSSSFAGSKKFIRFNDRALHDFDGATYSYAMRHDGRRGVMTIVPTPAEPETVTIRYTGSHPQMQYGTPAGIAASRIQLPASPTMGLRVMEDYILVGGRIMLTAGSALGDVRTVTSYNALTRSAGVDAAWTLTPGASTTTYEVLPGWVDDHCADVLIFDSLRRLETRNRDAAERWDGVYQQKLSIVLDMTKRLQRSQGTSIPLGRGQSRHFRRYLRPGQIF